MQAGVSPDRSDRCLTLGIGGTFVEVRFVEMKVRLYPPDSTNEDSFIEWEDEVGFFDEWKPTWPAVMGQMRFMSEFTVTMSRFSQCVAIEPSHAFDGRFEPPLAK
jgi:hypothetical protein